MLRKLKAQATAMKTISALLTRAEAIARNRGAERPAAEHLVMAALELSDGTATRALERLGASAEDFAAALEAEEADDLGRVGVRADTGRIGAQLPEATAPGGVYRSEASARELFRAAADDARRGGGGLTGAHVLRAAAALEHGAAARALRRMGIDRTELRTAARVEIDCDRA